MSNPTVPRLKGRMVYLYQFICAECQKVFQSDPIVGRTGESIVIPPEVPDGWNTFNDQTFCEKHKVTLAVEDAVGEPALLDAHGHKIQ